ncbi:hypothetical protein CLBKND_03367 [Methylorubrum aminovorans]
MVSARPNVRLQAANQSPQTTLLQTFRPAYSNVRSEGFADLTACPTPSVLADPLNQVDLKPAGHGMRLVVSGTTGKKYISHSYSSGIVPCALLSKPRRAWTNSVERYGFCSNEKPFVS